MGSHHEIRQDSMPEFSISVGAQQQWEVCRQAVLALQRG